MSAKYGPEYQTARQAVYLASLATLKMQYQQDKGVSDKEDESPVTIADFAAQALLICVVNQAFPEDAFIAEETSDMLRENETLSNRVWLLVDSMRQTAFDLGVPVPRDQEEMLKLIDLGGKGQGSGSNGRLWVLDPVDGTKTFMKGEQYAVCLCFIEAGLQQVAALGCPNLLFENGRVEETLVDKDGQGLMLTAIRGGGAFSSKLGDYENDSVRLPVRSLSTDDTIRFTDSKESPHVRLDLHRQIYSHFGSKDGIVHDLWSMQMKYVALALGAVDASVRIPPMRDYRPATYDHVGGQLIFEEAGGKITDLYGRPFDVTAGRRLYNNWGVTAAVAGIHQKVFDEVQEVLKTY